MAGRAFGDIRFYVFCQGILQIGQFILGSYLRSIVTQIERRFELSSEILGRITTGFQIGSLLVIIPFSYVGNAVHRPRAIALCAIVMAVGALISVLPHLIMDKYEFEDVVMAANVSYEPLCSSPDVFVDDCATEESANEQSKLFNMWILLFLSQFVIGIGASALQPFGISYIDDNSKKKDSALYVAILLAISLIGPAFGFILGSITTTIYVDVGREGADEISIRPGDPRWVGAWWMGFLIASIWILVASIPFWFFPKKMEIEKESDTVAKTPMLSDNNDNNNNDDLKLKDELEEEVSLKKLVKEFPRVTLNVITNPVVVGVALQAMFHMAVIAGIATFMAKYLQNQFSISASKANLFIGTIGVPCVCIGILVGGVVMKRFNFSSIQAIRFAVTAKAIGVSMIIAFFFLGCDTPPSAGVNQPYVIGEEMNEFIGSCNRNCDCSREQYLPICGADGIRYYSPCHAGCSGSRSAFSGKEDDNQTINIYTDCNCVVDSKAFEDGALTALVEDGEAFESICPSESACFRNLVGFGVATFIGGLIESMCSSPIYIIFMRSVNPKAKSYSIGLINLIIRTIGFMPSPMYHGILIDSTCLQWGEKCGFKGACKIYDNYQFRIRYFGLQIGLSFCSLMSQCLAWFAISRRPDGGQDNEKSLEETNDRKVSGNLEAMADALRASTITLERHTVV